MTNSPEGPRRAGGMRRLLLAMLAVLAVAALGLLGVLVWVLQPEASTVTSSTVVGACPMQPVRSIYGYGTTAEERLLKPLAATFDTLGNIWVSDTGHSRLVVLSQEGQLVREVGARDDTPGRVQSPYGLAVDGEGRVYVADWTQKAVLIYAANGRYLDRLPAPDQDLEVFGPDGFAPYEVRLVGDRIAVSSHDGLYFFDRSGHVLARWGGEGRGSGTGDFNFPDAFDVDTATGRVYVADTLNRRVVALDPDGAVLWTSGKPDQNGKISGFWQLPRSVLVGEDGNVYVVDTFRFQEECAGVGHIVVLSPQGELLSEFGRAGGGEDGMSFPEKLAQSADGEFAIADREDNRILLFRLGPLPQATPREMDLYSGSFAGG